jgi:chemotaxis protein methyltransferase CheR
MTAGTLELSSTQFHAVSQLVQRICGINLHTGKYELVRARLTAQLRELQLADVDSYLNLVASDDSGRELARLIDLLTTNKTSFFREPRHFDLLRDRVLPELYVRNQPFRAWSAGCSSGEEPYSLAMVLNEQLGSAAAIRILATDISARMLARARAGVYPAPSVADVPPLLRRTAFRAVTGAPYSYSVSDPLRAMIRFAQLNLMGPWPMRGRFELICCRNVMIYFENATQQALVDRFWEMLVPGGYFFVGHSESFAALDHGFEYVQPAVYRRRP